GPRAAHPQRASGGGRVGGHLERPGGTHPSTPRSWDKSLRHAYSSHPCTHATAGDPQPPGAAHLVRWART
ncbi:MAG: hypothetical protein ACFFDE_12015, partial [Promethearchaeota archaeon]